jgi:YD repeat-containing protein
MHVGRRFIIGLVITGVLPMIELGCNTSNSPTTMTNASGGLCRTYVTAELKNMQPASLLSSASISGSFDPSTRQATYIEAFSVGGPICSTTVYSYASTADFVDEVSVIPPKPLLSAQSTTSSGTCGTATSSVTYTYDSAHRLTKVSSSDGTATTYTNWDTFGRPTFGTLSTGGSVSTVYDNSARTATTKSAAGTGTITTTLTYDENGILVMNADSTGLQTTYVVTATDKICK